jgi:hypothetical protein
VSNCDNFIRSQKRHCALVQQKPSCQPGRFPLLSRQKKACFTNYPLPFENARQLSLANGLNLRFPAAIYDGKVVFYNYLFSISPYLKKNNI